METFVGQMEVTENRKLQDKSKQDHVSMLMLTNLTLPVLSAWAKLCYTCQVGSGAPQQLFDFEISVEDCSKAGLGSIFVGYITN